MTPLFAATLASQGQTQTDGGYAVGPGEGMLRATQQQSLDFTPTQGMHGYVKAVVLTQGRK